MPSESVVIIERIKRVTTTRKWLIAIVTAVMLLLVIYYNETTVPAYEASTMLAFEQITQPLSSSDTEATKEILMQNRLQEIKSRSFALEIVQKLDRSAWALFEWPHGPMMTDSLSYLSGYVQTQITAMPISNSNIIRISVEANHSILSRDIADLAAKVLQDRNDRIRQEGTMGVRKFIERQLSVYEGQLYTAEENLKGYKEQAKITSIDQESQELLHRMTDVEVMYNTVKAKRGSTEEQLTSTRKIIAEQKQELVPNVMDIGSPWAQKIKEQLVALQGQFMELTIQKYPADHPKMVQLAQEIEQTRENLRQEANKLAGGKNLLDPITQMEKYMSEAVNLEIELESLKAQQIVLQATLDRYDTALRTLPDKESQLVRLLRDREMNQKLYMMLLEKHEAAKISEAERFADIRIIDQAFLPQEPVKPRKILNLAMGLLVGLIFGSALAFILESNKGFIASAAELEKIIEYPVLVSISQFEKTSRREPWPATANLPEQPAHASLITSLAPHTVSAEGFRILRTSLLFKGIGSKYKTILVISSVPAEGKTTTLANLAIALAITGQRVLMVDADLRLPRLHTLFNTDNVNGLGQVLEKMNAMNGNLGKYFVENRLVYESNKAQLKNEPAFNGVAFELEDESSFDTDDWHLRDFIRDTPVNNLSLIVSGTSSANPSELLTGPASRILIARLKKEFDVVLIDSAPIQLVSDALILSAIVDGVLLVVDPEKVDGEMLYQTKAHLHNAKADVIGAIRNRIDLPHKYKKYSNYYKSRQ